MADVNCELARRDWGADFNLSEAKPLSRLCPKARMLAARVTVTIKPELPEVETKCCVQS
jgi:hypothetical protein